RLDSGARAAGGRSAGGAGRQESESGLMDCGAAVPAALARFRKAKRRALPPGRPRDISWPSVFLCSCRKVSCRAMRRLFRILLNAATVLSLLLCVATVVLWLRSYWVSDEWRYSRVRRFPTGAEQRTDSADTNLGH